MRKFNYDDGQEGIEYETLDELLSAGINSAWETDGYYYIKLKPDGPYDNGMWRVDKKTKSVSYIDFTDFIINIEDNANEINPQVLLQDG